MQIEKPLVGTDESTIDDKGRVIFAKKKRERLGSNFTITLGDVGCVVVYPQNEWLATYNEIKQADRINSGRQEYSRDILGEAIDECELDNQGRIVLPRRLREKAKLDGPILVIGCGDHIEIWSASEYEIYDQDRAGYARKRRESMERAYRQMKGI